MELLHAGLAAESAKSLHDKIEKRFKTAWCEDSFPFSSRNEGELMDDMMRLSADLQAFCLRCSHSKLVHYGLWYQCQMVWIKRVQHGPINRATSYRHLAGAWVVLWFWIFCCCCDAYSCHCDMWYMSTLNTSVHLYVGLLRNCTVLLLVVKQELLFNQGKFYNTPSIR